MSLSQAQKKELSHQIAVALFSALLLFFCVFYFLRINSVVTESALKRVMDVTASNASAFSGRGADGVVNSELPPFYEGEGSLYIINQSGTILASSGELNAGEALLNDITFEPDEADSVKTIFSGSHGVVRGLLNGGYVYLSYCPVPDSQGLFSVGALPASSIKGEAGRIVRLSFFSLLFLCLIAGLLVVRVVKNRERSHKLILKQALSGKYSDSLVKNNLDSLPTPLEEELALALDESRITAFYEPVPVLSTGMLYCSIASMRWEHPRRGLLSGADFMPDINDTSLLVRCDVSLIRAVCQDMSQCFMRGIVFPPVIIPLPARLFADDSLPVLVSSLVREYGLRPQNFIAELVSDEFGSVPELISAISSLRDNGFFVSLCERGLSFSIMDIIKDIELDYVRIPESAIQNLNKNPRAVDALSIMLNFLHQFSTKALACRIRNSYQHEMLVSLGCDLGCGGLFSRPLSPLEMSSLIMGGSWQPVPEPDTEDENIYNSDLNGETPAPLENPALDDQRYSDSVGDTNEAVFDSGDSQGGIIENLSEPDTAFKPSEALELGHTDKVEPDSVKVADSLNTADKNASNEVVDSVSEAKSEVTTAGSTKAEARDSEEPIDNAILGSTAGAEKPASSSDKTEAMPRPAPGAADLKLNTGAADVNPVNGPDISVSPKGESAAIAPPPIQEGSIATLINPATEAPGNGEASSPENAKSSFIYFRDKSSLADTENTSTPSESLSKPNPTVNTPAKAAILAASVATRNIPAAEELSKRISAAKPSAAFGTPPNKNFNAPQKPPPSQGIKKPLPSPSGNKAMPNMIKGAPPRSFNSGAPLKPPAHRGGQVK